MFGYLISWWALVNSLLCNIRKINHSIVYSGQILHLSGYRYNLRLHDLNFYPNVTTLCSSLCYRKSVCRLSVCLSVTFVRPTQGVETFRNISSLLCILAILRPLRAKFTEIVPRKPLRRGRYTHGGNKIERWWTYRRLYLINGTRYGPGTINHQ